MKKILFPTDFSETSTGAMAYALQAAKQLGGKVDVLHIYHYSMVEAGGTPYTIMQQMMIEKKNEADRLLAEFIQPFAGNKHLGDVIPLYGLFLANEITDYAKLNNYDLVIMGTKGERNAIEKFLGSVTTQVMMSSNLPVLAIPNNCEFKEINHIAYATDFKPNDDDMIDGLQTFSKAFDAQVSLVHVEKNFGGVNESQSIDFDDYPDGFEDFTFISAETIMEGLDDYIREKQVDVLALFIPKRRLWERLFHQSFTKKMCFHTETPLLIFHG